MNKTHRDLIINKKNIKVYKPVIQYNVRQLKSVTAVSLTRFSKVLILQGL